MQYLTPGLGLAMAIAIATGAAAQSVAKPTRFVTDPGTITTGQAITPAGVQMVFKGRVQGVEFGRDGEIYALSRTHVYRLDWANNKVLAQMELGGVAGLRGLAFDRAAARPIVAYAAAGKGGKLGEVRLMSPEGAPLKLVGDALGQGIVGALTVHRGMALTPLTFNDKLAIVDLATGAARRVDVGVAPFATAADGKTAYVSNWGGVAAKSGEASAPTGLEPTADRVRIDGRGIAAAGTVSVVDLAGGVVTATIPVGRHPTALALNHAAGLLYVANTNDDTISVIDVRTTTLKATLAIKPFARDVRGVAPTALALSPSGETLYIACGGINAVAVYDLKSGRITGLIPTGWYPGSVSVNGDGTLIAVGTLLGVGSGQNDGPAKRYVHANRGSVHVIAAPDAAQLASYTAAVGVNNRMNFVDSVAPRPNASAAPKAVPARAGEASLIKHVVYIVKENRTYDQVFGDVAKGNGDPSLVMFGENVTPNQHRLATDFVLLDNFYATGGNSADGHQWLTQANEVSYTLWPGYVGRSYPFDGSDPLAYSSGGFIWDAALAQKKTVAVFGEYAPRNSAVTLRDRPKLMARWQAGETFGSEWNATSPIPPLDRVLVRNYPSYTTNIPDVIRAQVFIDSLKTYETAGAMPNLTIVQLPSNHTNGTAPGTNTPSAMAADNDLAVGMVVEALTHSKFWPEMAILVVEDDSQNGVDHVDGHRTVALAISPYTRRGAVDSTFYSHQSMLKTIELMLGLPTMSLFDLIATDMRASFQDTPNLRPFKAIIPQQSLTEMNPEAAALPPGPRSDAKASAAMRWDVPDAAPTEKLNRIVWRAVKGARTPYPAVAHAVFSPFQFESEDDDGDEADSKDAH